MSHLEKEVSSRMLFLLEIYKFKFRKLVVEEIPFFFSSSAKHKDCEGCKFLWEVVFMSQFEPWKNNTSSTEKLYPYAQKS